MGTAHESIFSYSISRLYPFKWFTPVVLVVLVAATALFSFLNFASNGYDLVVKTALDPNATVSDNNLFQKWPSYLTSKIQPSCQDVDIHVNAQLFTNQTALTYTLIDVWQTSADGGNRTILPSLTYHNNPIEQCAVSSIEVDLESLDRGANQIVYTEWGPSVRAYVP